MSNKTTLEDFVKNYVNNKKSSESKEDYKSWLKANGVDSGAIYDDAIKDITGDYARAKSEYGSIAESLGSIGLTASGYSDYLNGKAYSEMQKRKSGARRQYIENESKNKAGYADYIANIAKAESDTYNSVINEISNAGILSFDEAYEIAVGKGLTGELATLAAKTASNTVKKKLRDDALKTIIGQSYNKKQAREYALALGLSEDEAEELSNYADKINREGYYSSDYLEYLKNKWAE